MSAEPTFLVPLEMVEQLVSATGMAMMVRARMRWARFQPAARVFVRAGRFVAEIEFEAPIGPERESCLVVMLTVRPDALRCAEAAVNDQRQAVVGRP